MNISKMFDKINVKSALSQRNTFDLSCDHVTTMNFFEPKVSYSKEIVPGESTEINLENFIRLAPLAVPAFMRCSMQSRAFYVPFRTVWEGWNYFITSSAAPNGNVFTKVPFVTNGYLVSCFLDSGNGFTNKVTTVSEHNYDFSYIYMNASSAVSTSYYKFTQIGRLLYDCLIGLGYKLDWNNTTASYNDTYSALPLMCYYKALCDWYFVNQYTSTNDADVLRATLAYTGDPQLTSLQIGDMLRKIAGSLCNYDNDYFTSAFNNPNGPSNGLQTNISIPNTATNNTYGLNALQVMNSNITNNEAVMTRGSSTYINGINQFAVDALKSLSDYLKRHQLAGSQVVDRYAARFGMKLNSEKINKSTYLGTFDTPIQIGDIYNTNGDTQSAGALGNYAGKGVGYGNGGHFNVSSDEYGFFIVISNIVPHVGYYQGVKRQVMHVNVQDYFTPEFDGLGNQAIAMKEISLPYDAGDDELWLGNYQDGSVVPNSIFGYTPRYAEYKFGNDFMTGNYIYNSTNVGESAWYGMRMFPDYTHGDVDHSSLIQTTTAGTGFLRTSDKNQYSRIFATNDQDISEGNDAFRVIMHFDVKANLPMRKLFDNYEFEDKGKDVTLQLGGEGVKN